MKRDIIERAHAIYARIDGRNADIKGLDKLIARNKQELKSHQDYLEGLEKEKQKYLEEIWQLKEEVEALSRMALGLLNGVKP